MYLRSAAAIVGWLLDKEDFKTDRSAIDNLITVVLDSFFALEDKQDFAYNIYVDGLTEFQEWLAESWQSALIPAKTFLTIEELIRKEGPSSKIVVKTTARMTKLRII